MTQQTTPQRPHDGEMLRRAAELEAENARLQIENETYRKILAR